MRSSQWHLLSHTSLVWDVIAWDEMWLREVWLSLSLVWDLMIEWIRRDSAAATQSDVKQTSEVKRDVCVWQDVSKRRLMRRVCTERGLERDLLTLYHATACVCQKRRVCMNRSICIPTEAHTHTPAACLFQKRRVWMNGRLYKDVLTL